MSIPGKFADKKKEEPTTYCTIIRPIYPSSAALVLTHLPKKHPSPCPFFTDVFSKVSLPFHTFALKKPAVIPQIKSMSLKNRSQY